MIDISAKLSIANQLREHEKFAESTQVFTECLIAQVDKNDYSGQIHSICGQSIIYRILSKQTKNQVYKDLAFSFTSIAINILESHKNVVDIHTQAICLSSHADSLILLGKAEESLKYYEEAIKISPASKPEVGRLKAHLGGVRYLLGGGEKGINLIKEGLADIRTGNMTEYDIRVWETGALNSLAKIYLIEGQDDKALQIAKESHLISINHKLSIREKESEEIIKKISSGDKNFSL